MNQSAAPETRKRLRARAHTQIERRRQFVSARAATKFKQAAGRLAAWRRRRRPELIVGAQGSPAPRAAEPHHLISLIIDMENCTTPPPRAGRPAHKGCRYSLVCLAGEQCATMRAGAQLRASAASGPVGAPSLCARTSATLRPAACVLGLLNFCLKRRIFFKKQLN